MVAFFLVGQIQPEINSLNKTIFYSTLLLAYVISSMGFVNRSYRYTLMCEILGINRIESETSRIWMGLREKFFNQEKDIDLLEDYFSSAIKSFEEGSYEEAFLSAYKVINEETIVNPKDFISDKRESAPSSFSEIRTIIMHSRRKKIEIDVERIMEIRKTLPKYDIEILERCFDFLKSIL